MTPSGDTSLPETITPSLRTGSTSRRGEPDRGHRKSATRSLSIELRRRTRAHDFFFLVVKQVNNSLNGSGPMEWAVPLVRLLHDGDFEARLRDHALIMWMNRRLSMCSSGDVPLVT